MFNHKVNSMYPLLAPFFGFISGILIGDGFDLSYKTLLLLLVISAVPSVILSFRKSRFYPSVALAPFIAAGALFIHPYAWPQLPPNHIRNLISRSDAQPQEKDSSGTDVTGTVLSVTPGPAKSVRLVVEAAQIAQKQAWVETSGRILLTMEDGPALRPGDGIRFTARLREPENFGNPGEYDYKGRLRREGIFVTAYVSKPAFIVKTHNGEPGFMQAIGIEAARDSIRRFINDNAANKAPLNALIIGESAGLDRATREAFAATSTAHILAISGLHVGIVGAAFYGLLLFLFKRSQRLMLEYNVRKAALLATVVPVAAYGGLAGFPVSATRAVLMACVFALTFIMNRGKAYWNTLALSGLIILLIDPTALWEISFQLSFAAVAGIIYIQPRLAEATDALFVKGAEDGWWRRFVRQRILAACFVTVAASVATAPLIAYHFHRASLIGLAANLIVVPLVSLIVPLLLAAAASMIVWAGLAKALLFFADGIFSVLEAVVRFFAGLPYSSVWVTTPTPLELALYCCLMVSLVNMKKARIYVLIAPVMAFTLIGDWGYWNYYARETDGLKATYISVGQGDSALVEFGHGSTMLIDGGGFYKSEYDTGERIVAPLLWQKKISRIDYVVLSHPQRDHIAGLSFITRAFKPKEFWWNGDAANGGIGELGAILADNGAVIKTPKEIGTGIMIDGATIELLHPLNAGVTGNDASLVVRVSYGSRSLLFTGDLTEKGETYLVRKGLRADVLKVAHHGSRYSTSSGFLNMVKPSVAVISAGRGNRFGFPHTQTLDRLRQAGADVYRTDLDGAVTVTTDGKDIWTKTEKSW